MTLRRARWSELWRKKHNVMTKHWCDVIMGAMVSQITSLTIVYSTVHSGADQRKHQSSASLAFVRGIHRWSVNFPHKWPVTRKMFPLDDVIMEMLSYYYVPQWSVILMCLRSPVMRNFDVYFILSHLNSLFNKPLGYRWFYMPCWSCYVIWI